MEWVFLLSVITVLWLIERQFNELSKSISGLETRLDVLADDFEKFKKGEEGLTPKEGESPRE